MRSGQRTQQLPFCGHLAFEANQKVKKLDKWVPHDLTGNQKYHFELLSSLILCNNNEPFLDQIVMCDDKWILYDSLWWPARGGLRRSTKALHKAKLAPRKGHGHCLVVCCPSDVISCLNPFAESMLSKSVRCIENCNACSQHWLTERVQFFSMTVLDHTLHNLHFKSWMSWSFKFCLICCIHLTSRQLTITWSILTTFLQGKCFHNQQEAENAFRELNPEAQVFMLHE